ncbi:DNA-binding response regulator [Malaciobacter halophilus]|nr:MULTISPECIES: response regulator transcription factor [Malaciobacter]PHO13772.1 DNA-binding response regulator [Malaciobacter marinus]PHO16276.1 DNA-binding response regulator [Malaciobacter marinus]RYA22319.1 DNA-binding response regulator [Malaciobacter halophilus]
MKILILEDNFNLANIIKEMLEEKNYKVDSFNDGNLVLDNFMNGYDCFILDINVPNIDGLTLLKTIRDYDISIPVIIISSNIELNTIKNAYIKGCNDFLKKPFYIYELEAKIDLLCKKDTIIYLNNDFYFNTNEEILYNNLNKEIHLTHKEKQFLILASKYPSQSISLELIEQYVWEGEMASTMSIRSLIKRLRMKLPKDSIETTTYGYKVILTK